MTDRQLTAHGELLDSARVALGISQREAARRASISEGRWRQVITGVQRQGGISIPVNPRASTLASMAQAVQADTSAVLAAAGLSLDQIDEDQPQTEAELSALASLRAEVLNLRTEVAELKEELRGRGA